MNHISPLAPPAPKYIKTGFGLYNWCLSSSTKYVYASFFQMNYCLTHVFVFLDGFTTLGILKSNGLGTRNLGFWNFHWVLWKHQISIYYVIRQSLTKKEEK